LLHLRYDSWHDQFGLCVMQDDISVIAGASPSICHRGKCDFWLRLEQKIGEVELTDYPPSFFVSVSNLRHRIYKPQCVPKVTFQVATARKP
jgi:hypothetical protein